LFRKIQNTISNFFAANRLLILAISCISLILIFGYFSTQDSKAQLANCTSDATLNTTFPPNICAPVACPSLSAGEVRSPDDIRGYNCYYAPLGESLIPCKKITSYEKSAGVNYAISDIERRVNCSDIIDLPLCSVVAGAVIGVNCVPEAKDVSSVGSGSRGADYAVHNTDSIRFCGAVETCGAGENCDNTAMTAPTPLGCTQKQCHQYTEVETPDKNSNCTILTCDLLAFEELNEDKRFLDDSKQYCEGSDIKCYTFPQTHLQYVKYRVSNPMCQIHDCSPPSPAYGADDSLNISKQGDPYQDSYEENITEGDLSSICNRVLYKPIYPKRHLCSADPANPTNTDLIIMDTSCDSCSSCVADEDCPEENGCLINTKIQSCVNGTCKEEIDCNIAANSGDPLCSIGSLSGIDNTSTDWVQSWFYRPTPSQGIVDSNGFIEQKVSNVIKPRVAASIADALNPLPADPALASVGATKNGICYEYDDVGGKIDFGLFSIAIGHSKMRICYPDTNGSIQQIANDGVRSIGFGSIYGNDLNLYAPLLEESAYIKGFARADYASPNSPKYKISGCLRYTSIGLFFTTVPSTKAVNGQRECHITISRGSSTPAILNQICGFDVCQELIVDSQAPKECSLSKNPNSTANNCVAPPIDLLVRMRAVQYGRKLCVFVDQNGIFAANPIYYNGTETLDDGITCVDGTVETIDPSTPACLGKNTNEDDGSASVWRTHNKIRYIGNANSSGGYYDLNDRFFAAQDCARIPLRIGPGRFYQVVTAANTPDLFAPPLYILNSNTSRNGTFSTSNVGGIGNTDFFWPEIIAKYSTTEQRMSLALGYIGTETIPETFTNAPSEFNFTNPSTPFAAYAFLKKEYNEKESQPKLCLYRKTASVNGSIGIPKRIACVSRNIPEIRDSNNNMKAVIENIPDPNSATELTLPKLKLKLIASLGANGVNDNCGSDDSCTNSFEFSNPNIDQETCTKDIEENKFCSKRSSCSRLVYECIQNEIDLNNALNSNPPLVTSSFDAIKYNCENSLLENCNAKFGITNSDNIPDFLSQIDNNPIIATDPNYQNFQSILNPDIKARIDAKYMNGTEILAYGWFNEICITSGFKGRLKNIVAYDLENGLRGKCLISGSSLYLQDNDSTTNCDAGGKAPYCICTESPNGVNPNPSKYKIRSETPRESGLCIDIPIPKLCLAINYGGNDYQQSSITNSLDNNIFVQSPYDSASYANINGVHNSHYSRTMGSLENSTQKTHGEYISMLGGVNDIRGQCTGFWKVKNTGGIDAPPLLDCGIDGSWNNPRDYCIRYSCPTITTDYSNSSVFDGIYSNNYAAGEAGDNRGLKNGFAIWPNFTKNNDFLEAVSATSCIVGYKTSGSAIPQRVCTQIGEWKNDIVNQCERKTCPEIRVANNGGNIIALPAVYEDNKDAWDRYGGATFDSKEASRSSVFVPTESKGEGACNAAAGFHTGIRRPTMECINDPANPNGDGIWSNLENPCQRECNAIFEGGANWPDRWPSYTPQPIEGTCSTNPRYVINPSGNLPTRNCTSVNNISTWGAISDPCVDKCPAETTQENTSSGIIIASWNATDIGIGNSANYANDVFNCVDTINANSFAPGRTNDCYHLRRSCGSNGVWNDVEPMCVANDGRLGNAKYKAPATSPNEFYLAGGGATINGYCVDNTTNAGFTAAPNSGTPPNRKCEYKDTNKNIDQVAFNLTNSDCAVACLATQNMNIAGNAMNKYNGATKNVAVGGTIPITHDGTNTCHNAGTPTATCGANGQFNLSSPYRKCNDCSGNPLPINWLVSISNDLRTTNTFLGTNYSFATSMNHGGSSGPICRYVFQVHYVFPLRRCFFTSSRVTVGCNDGNYNVSYDNNNTSCMGDPTLISEATLVFNGQNCGTRSTSTNVN
jgi:hypothetical protein